MSYLSSTIRRVLLMSTLGALLVGGAVRAQSAERKVLKRVDPYYPDVLRTRKIGGTVRLKVFVEASGRVRDVQLEGGNPILGESAMRAVKEWRYEPGERETIATVMVHFDPDK
jgi:TonB family protein